MCPCTFGGVTAPPFLARPPVGQPDEISPSYQPMTRRIFALAIVVLALLVWTVLLRTRDVAPAESGAGLHAKVEAQGAVNVEAPPPAAPAPPPVEPPPASQQPAPETAEATPIGKFVPGHFPGVSVSHEPGTHRSTPPQGTPRTIPQQQEIVLPDGRRLIGATLDETWRVPLRLNAKP